MDDGFCKELLFWLILNSGFGTVLFVHAVTYVIIEFDVLSFGKQAYIYDNI